MSSTPTATSPILLYILSSLPPLVVVASWVLMAELIQGLQNGWQKPFFITYCIHGGYILNFLIYGAIRLGKAYSRQKYTLHNNPPPTPNPSVLHPIFDDDDDECDDAHDDEAPKVTSPIMQSKCKRYMLAAFFLQLLAAGVAMTWYISLPQTSIAGNNAVYQSASAFVFFLQYFFVPPRKKESPLSIQLSATALCIAGVMLISFAAPSSSSSSSSTHETVTGYMWVLLSTLSYSVYEVAYAILVHEESSTDNNEEEQDDGEDNKAVVNDHTSNSRRRRSRSLPRSESRAWACFRQYRKRLRKHRRRQNATSTTRGGGGARGIRGSSSQSHSRLQQQQQQLDTDDDVNTDVPLLLDEPGGLTSIATTTTTTCIGGTNTTPLITGYNNYTNDSDYYDTDDDDDSDNDSTFSEQPSLTSDPPYISTSTVQTVNNNNNTNNNVTAYITTYGSALNATTNYQHSSTAASLASTSTSFVVATTMDASSQQYQTIDPLKPGGGGGGGAGTSAHKDNNTSNIQLEKHRKNIGRKKKSKRKVKSNLMKGIDHAESASFVLGCMGLFTLITLLPMFPILNATGVEPFEWPATDKFHLLMLNVGLDSIYNLALLTGIATAGPLGMSIASMLVVPASVAADWILHALVPSPQAIGGMLLILCGFGILQIPWRSWWSWGMQRRE